MQLQSPSAVQTLSTYARSRLLVCVCVCRCVDVARDLFRQANMGPLVTFEGSYSENYHQAHGETSVRRTSKFLTCGENWTACDRVSKIEWHHVLRFCRP